MPPTAPPSIYDSMAKMSLNQSPADKKGGQSGDSKGGGSIEEKKQIVTTLLEVLKKWDALESDQAGKKIIADMSALAQRYQSEILKEGGAPSASPTEPPPDAAAAASDMGQKSGGSAKMAVPA